MNPLLDDGRVLDEAPFRVKGKATENVLPFFFFLDNTSPERL